MTNEDVILMHLIAHTDPKELLELLPVRTFLLNNNSDRLKKIYTKYSWVSPEAWEETSPLIQEEKIIFKSASDFPPKEVVVPKEKFRIQIEGGSLVRTCSYCKLENVSIHKWNPKYRICSRDACVQSAIKKSIEDSKLAY